MNIELILVYGILFLCLFILILIKLKYRNYLRARKYRETHIMVDFDEYSNEMLNDYDYDFPVPKRSFDFEIVDFDINELFDGDDNKND